MLQERLQNFDLHVRIDVFLPANVQTKKRKDLWILEKRLEREPDR